MGLTEQGSRTELEEAHHWFNLFMGDVEHKKIILSNRIKLKLSQMFATMFKPGEIHIFTASQPLRVKAKWRKKRDCLISSSVNLSASHTSGGFSSADRPKTPMILLSLLRQTSFSVRAVGTVTDIT